MRTREELERIYDEHAACAFSVFRRFSCCESEVRDLLQDWLIKIASERNPLRDPDNERAYLLKIAYRLAVDWTRRNQTRQKYTEQAAGELSFSTLQTEPDPDRALMKQSIEESLNILPKDQQLVVLFKLRDELTFAQIGDILQISPNTAASRYRYGIEKMQEALLPIYEELSPQTKP